MSIKILIADDHKIVREGLRTLIEKQPGMKVIAESENGREAVQLAINLLPDVVIMDILMPELNGVEATRKIITEAPGVKVVALSMYSDRQFVVEMLRAGASGYLLKDCAFEELIHAINAVCKNRSYLSLKIADTMLKDYINLLPETDLSIFSMLTAREREVLQLLAEGNTTKEIAFKLDVSVKTIETYRKQIMDKLGTHSIAELTKYAIREGLTSL